MKKIFLITYFTILFIYSSCDQKYTKYAQYSNTLNKQRIVFSQDQRIAMLYNNKDSKMQFYRSYDMKLLYEEDLQVNPAYLSTFTEVDGTYAMVFGSQDGLIYKKKYSYQSGISQQLLATIQKCVLKKVIPSSDKNTFAVLCQNQNSIRIASLQKEGQVAQVIFQFTVTAISWHPQENKIAIGGFIDDKNFRLIIYDLDKKTSVSYSELVAHNIIDIQFSDDGNSLAFIEEGNSIIKIINIKDKTLSFLAASQANQLVALKRSNKIITAYDSQYTYVWIFDNTNFGKYDSIMKSTGLSPSAGFLYTINPLNQKIIQNKICQINQILSDTNCIKCSQQCATCFGIANQCSSCSIGNYFIQSKFQCKSCIQFCKTCVDDQTCTECLDSYFKIDGVCKSCADIFTGCVTCDEKVCTKCNDAENWYLDGTKCSCKSRFVQIDNKCEACPNHCLKCSDTQTCTLCDIIDHRVLKDKQCVCGAGYFQDKVNDKCLSCTKGCLTCDNKQTCQICDEKSHWILDDKTKTCNCAENYILDSQNCFSCSMLIYGCVKCQSKDKCTTCADGYTLNDSSKCDLIQPDDGIGVGIIILIGGAGLIVVGLISYLILRIMKKNKEKKVQTLLQSEGENQNEELR